MKIRYNYIAILVCKGLLLSSLAACQSPEEIDVFSYPASEKPDRIILTWSDDPKTTQSVTWRTAAGVEGYAQIVQETAQAVIQEDDELDFSLADELDTILPAETHEAATKLLEWQGETASYHSVTFRNLEPGTSYLYRVGNGEGVWSEWHRFETDSGGEEPFGFVYLGDAQNNILEHWSRTIRASYSHFPEAKFMVHTGDLVLSSGGDYTWGNWHEAGGWIHATRPSIPTPGNSDHFRLDTEGTDQRMVFPQWRANFTLPENGPEELSEYAYYIDYRNIRVISLYSNFESIRSDREILLDRETRMTYDIMEKQTEWLRGILETNPQQWTIVIYHHPMFTGREERHNHELQNQWRDLFIEHKVDLVLQGHDHTYGRGRDPVLKEELGDERTGPVYTISNAGAKSRPLDRTGEAHDWADILGENIQLYQYIEVNGGSLTYSAFLANGELFDRFRLYKEDPWNRFEELKPGHELEWHHETAGARTALQDTF